MGTPSDGALCAIAFCFSFFSIVADRGGKSNIFLHAAKGYGSIFGIFPKSLALCMRARYNEVTKAQKEMWHENISFAKGRQFL
jgi:hypothetical protein